MRLWLVAGFELGSTERATGGFFLGGGHSTTCQTAPPSPVPQAAADARNTGLPPLHPPSQTVPRKAPALRWRLREMVLGPATLHRLQVLQNAVIAGFRQRQC